jgi:hypothetical protein
MKKNINFKAMTAALVAAVMGIGVAMVPAMALDNTDMTIDEIKVIKNASECNAFYTGAANAASAAANCLSDVGAQDKDKYPWIGIKYTTVQDNMIIDWTQVVINGVTPFATFGASYDRGPAGTYVSVTSYHDLYGVVGDANAFDGKKFTIDFDGISYVFDKTTPAAVDPAPEATKPASTGAVL